MHDGVIKIRIAAPAVENAANEALVDFVAEALEVSKRSVRIASGGTSRRKVLAIDGVVSSEQPGRRTRVMKTIHHIQISDEYLKVAQRLVLLQRTFARLLYITPWFSWLPPIIFSGYLVGMAF